MCWDSSDLILENDLREVALVVVSWMAYPPCKHPAVENRAHGVDSTNTRHNREPLQFLMAEFDYCFIFRYLIPSRDVRGF
jgi:hypothetical protein